MEILGNMSIAPPTPDVPPAPDIQPHRRVLWKWSLGISALILAYVVWQLTWGFGQGKRLTGVAVERFHQQYNAGKYEEIFREADDRWAGTMDDWVAFCVHTQKDLGAAGSTRLGAFATITNTDGTFINTLYVTEFEKATVTEKFTWAKKSKAVKLQGYELSHAVFKDTTNAVPAAR